MEHLSDGEPCVTGVIERYPYPHCDEGNDLEEDMGLSGIVNEDMEIFIEKLGLNNISETVY